MDAFLNGLMVSGSLIIAIGAQNAFVLKQGLHKQNVGVVIFLCWFCDVILMGAGVFGISALISNQPTAMVSLGLAGAAFLLLYGLSSAKRAWRGGSHLEVKHHPAERSSSLTAASTTLAITLLNPHVYVDTIMLIGGSAIALSTVNKLWFLLGALLASAVWFIGIGYGARLLLPLFRRERVWQWLDGLIALMMFYLAYRLLQSIWSLLT